MIKSMTGYGSAKGTVEGLGITVELKSVNNRYLDASVRMPRSFLFAEDAVKSVVQKHISRGKVDVFVSVDSSAAGDMSVKVNEPLLRGYVEAIRHIAEEYSLPDDVTALSVSRFPDVLTVEKNDLDAEAISQGIVEIAELALQDFDAMRLREGEKLRDDVTEKLASIDALVTKIEKESPKTVAEYRARLEARMAEVLGTAGIEESRILAEAAVFADHVAVDEETVRLYKERGAFLCTTISPALPYALFDTSVSGASEKDQYNGKIVFDGVVESAKTALANGIPVGLGNDVGCPYITQYDFWRELCYFHKYCGVSNRFALYTATLRNAQLAGIGDVTGSIAPGKSADFIVTRKNPLEDLRALQHLELVVCRGRAVKKPSPKRKKEVDALLDPYLV